jgi:phosphatidate cytidylyltransferase
MKKIIERLLVFIIGIPAVIAVVLYLPFCNHLPMNIIVIVFSAIGAVEFSNILKKKQLHISKIEAAAFGALLPLAATLIISFNFREWVFPVFLLAASLWALLSGVFSRTENMENVIKRLAAGFSVIIYPGFFMYWLVKMTEWNNPSGVLVFLLIVFANDSTAWLAGNLFGGNNRGLIAASPNKSIAGYIGGLVGSIIVCAGAVLLFPNIFPAYNGEVPMTMAGMAVILGFCTGIAASLGDLAESAIKRSCDVKDSGKIMLGRGGILDSIDSIAVAAPVYFLLYSLFFIR